ncbi:MAG: hypothetical protein JNL57_06565 [Bacteroidetes bacterium]|nr:hypothetical protein [Bacteroidota bacterium]
MKNHIIIYDADCPLCRWYTGAFVKHGLLPADGREPYQHCGPNTRQVVDMARARNEIALLNKETGEVTYGYRSLSLILQQRWKWIRTATTHRILAPCISGLYSFISYNRKVMAPASGNGSYLECIPDRHWGYRIFFMAMCLLLVNAVVGAYFEYHLAAFGHHFIPFREGVFFIAQLLFQFIAMRLLRQQNAYDYLAHVGIVSALGAIGLGIFGTVLQVMTELHLQTGFLPGAGLGAVMLWMFLEHKRRVDLLGLSPALSYTWLLFRICIYPIAFAL